MSTFETKTADNFIFDETHDPRDQMSESTPFLRKNVTYVTDQQAGNGSYTNGEVIIDSQSVSSSGNLIDWRNGYIATAKMSKLECTFATDPVTFTAPSQTYAKYMLAIKNNSTLDSLKVEANGKVILTATQGLANLVNYKLLSVSTSDSITKDGAVINFYPDEVGQVGTTTTSVNNANAPNIITTNADGPIGVNRGLIERQNNFLPTYNVGFMDGTNVLNEGGTIEAAAIGSAATAGFTVGTAKTTVTELHYVAIIRLKDIADYFDKHVLSRGVSYRFTLKFNQAVTTLTYASSTIPFAAAPTAITTVQTSGSAQPTMLCTGPATYAAAVTLGTASVVTLVVTDAIDTSGSARINGIRLYVPSYELDPTHQERLLSQPIIKRSFMDFSSQTTQTAAAAGARINVQVSTSCTNPKALIVIPRWSQTGAQGFYSDVSPLSTVPGSTDGLLSLTNIQVKMGSSYVLPDRMFYGWQQYLDHASTIFATNGNQTGQTSGLITKKMWEGNHRYYAFDLSRYPEAMNNLPQMISLECDNNTKVLIELQCILLNGRDVEFNLAAGSMTITA